MSSWMLSTSPPLTSRAFVRTVFPPSYPNTSSHRTPLLGITPSIEAQHPFLAVLDTPLRALLRPQYGVPSNRRRRHPNKSRIRLLHAAAQPLAYVGQHLTWLLVEDCFTLVAGSPNCSMPFAGQTTSDGVPRYGRVTLYQLHGGSEHGFVADSGVLQAVAVHPQVENWLEMLRSKLGEV